MPRLWIQAMQDPVRMFVTLLLSLIVLTACGQKGPLFLPGDPSQMRSVPPQQEVVEEESEEDDEEEPIKIQ